MPALEDRPILGFRAWTGLISALLVVGCSHSMPEGEKAAEPTSVETATPFAEEGGLPYDVVFNTTDQAPLDPTLESAMRAASQLLALIDKPTATMSALRRRAVEDATRMVDVLKSKGYYQATADAVVTQDEDEATVTVSVMPGDAYLIGDFQVVYEGAPPTPDTVPDIEDVGMVLGMFAEADQVIAAEKGIKRHFLENGYPDVLIKDRKVTVNHSTQLMAVRLAVDTGPVVTFGDVRITGTNSVRESYLRKLIPWKTGDTYKASTLDQYRRTLRESGLFGSVAAKLDPVSASGGQAPVAVVVEEAAHRSLGAGLNFSTSEGPGGKVFWEHRNIFGEAETLRLTAAGSVIEQSVEAAFRKPSFLHKRQDFVAQTEAKREETEAYDSVGLTARAGLERKSGDYWKTGLFATAEVTEITDQEGEQTAKLFGMPVFIERDSTDALLDPTEGSRMGVYATPYIGHGEQPLAFGVLEARASAYYAVDDDGDFVLAARSRIGSILGESREELPANKRLFSGGGGSVRGYAFQLAGPLEADNDPEGGLSVLEFGTEARIKITDDFGVVPFIDGGRAGLEVHPSDFDDLLWAGGLGLRYYTPIGPLRFDVAMPINRRQGVDDPYQIYISLGQAF